MHHKIVHTHGNQINPHTAMHVGVDGNLKLGAHAIIGCHKNRVFKSSTFQIKKTAKAANVTVSTRATRCFNQWADPFDQCVPGVDIDPRL